MAATPDRWNLSAKLLGAIFAVLVSVNAALSLIEPFLDEYQFLRVPDFSKALIKSWTHEFQQALDY